MDVLVILSELLSQLVEMPAAKMDELAILSELLSQLVEMPAGEMDVLAILGELLSQLVETPAGTMDVLVILGEQLSQLVEMPAGTMDVLVILGELLSQLVEMPAAKMDELAILGEQLADLSERLSKKLKCSDFPDRQVCVPTHRITNPARNLARIREICWIRRVGDLPPSISSIRQGLAAGIESALGSRASRARSPCTPKLPPSFAPFSRDGPCMSRFRTFAI